MIESKLPFTLSGMEWAHSLQSKAHKGTHDSRSSKILYSMIYAMILMDTYIKGCYLVYFQRTIEILS